MKTKEEILKDTFGFNSFREHQEEVIDCILDNKDVLMILPTGGGKSLSYQLPSLMMDGVTVVISPLLALMQDQVSALQSSGIKAEMLSSMQTSDEARETIKDLYNNNLSFLYLSPEKLNTAFIYDLLDNIKVNFFVIDEAHCISEWGHDFRDDYRELSQLKTRYPNKAITAFTATAVSKIRLDISKELRLDNPQIFVGHVYRENLFVKSTYRQGNGHKQLLEFIAKQNNQNGIIYVSSRKQSESLSTMLNKNGHNSMAYHAGLGAKKREGIYKKFMYDKIDIVVATIAFGMGIDKSNIRYVVHMSLPKTLENYYQEIGRAGRDGDRSEVLMLFGASDIATQKRFISEIQDETHKAYVLQKLSTMYRYATSQICRHKQIAQYFEDDMQDCKHFCDNCVQEDSVDIDITKFSQMFLSTIYKTNQRFGRNYIIDILRGSKEQKVLSNNGEQLSVYGIGMELNRKQWFVIGDRLLELGIIDVGEYSVQILTPSSKEILTNKTKVFIRKERLDVALKEAVTKTQKNEIVDFDNDIFEDLRKIRAMLAKENSVPAYIILGDKGLKDMSNKLPKTREQMLLINGIGEKKFDLYGQEFLDYFLKD